MATPQIALAQTGLSQFLSNIHAAFVTPPTIKLASPTLSPPAGFNNASTQTIVSSGIDRYYALNIPNNYGSEVQQQWPLIIDYHGYTDDPHDQWDNSQYYKYDDGQNYLVAYPAGLNNAWQGASYAAKGVNDIQFTTDLLAHLMANYNIDPQRVYASGKSNGGGFVDTLACSDDGDAFAAFAVAAGAFYTDNSLGDCSKKRAMLDVHGTADKVVSYTGGKGVGGDLPDISDWFSWWGERTCGADTDAQTTTTDNYNMSSYSCGGPVAAVQHYKAFGYGHCWPCASGTNFDSSGKNCNTHPVDFTQAVLDFFGQWNLSNAPKN